MHRRIESVKSATCHTSSAVSQTHGGGERTRMAWDAAPVDGPGWNLGPLRAWETPPPVLTACPSLLVIPPEMRPSRDDRLLMLPDRPGVCWVGSAAGASVGGTHDRALSWVSCHLASAGASSFYFLEIETMYGTSQQRRTAREGNLSTYGDGNHGCSHKRVRDGLSRGPGLQQHIVGEAIVGHREIGLRCAALHLSNPKQELYAACNQIGNSFMASAVTRIGLHHLQDPT